MMVAADGLGFYEAIKVSQFYDLFSLSPLSFFLILCETLQSHRELFGGKKEPQLRVQQGVETSHGVLGSSLPNDKLTGKLRISRKV